MTRFFYNSFILLYWTIIRVFTLFNAKARQFVRGRQEVHQRIAESGLSGYKRKLWMHVSSLGEFEQGRPIIEGLRGADPDLGIILTFFSPSGYEVRKDYSGAEVVTYLPMDMPGKVRRFLDSVKPDIAVVVKNDFWLNYMASCIAADVPVVAVSSVFRPTQVYFNRARSLFLPVFKRCKFLFVQDEESAKVLTKYNISQHQCTGDTRVDRVMTVSKEGFQHQGLEHFCENVEVIIYGSTWPSDIRILQKMIASFPGMRHIIAPHEIKRESLREVTDNLGVDFQMLSSYDPAGGGEVMVVDEIGLLSRMYRLARFAYIGGAFQGAVHNTLEPLAYGLPVFIGSHQNVSRFKEIADLIPVGGIRLTDQEGESMVEDIQRMQRDGRLYKEVSKTNEDYIQDHAGASETVIDYLKDALR